MTTNRELKNLLQLEEDTKRYEATRNLLKLEQSLKDFEPYTANDAAFDRIKLMAEKRAIPENHYGKGECLSRLWAMRWSWIVLIVLYLA